LPALREAARDCRACDLYKTGTQTVFGEGAEHAQIMFVGEQPGDREDIEGKPFVGPAGRLLDEALEEAGIDRRGVYVTNAVKHFKWKPQGTRRLHHPSSILRAPDDETRELEMRAFVRDLKRIAAHLQR
jgi:uracil-DNA glycosylase